MLAYNHNNHNVGYISTVCITFISIGLSSWEQWGTCEHRIWRTWNSSFWLTCRSMEFVLNCLSELLTVYQLLLKSHCVGLVYFVCLHNLTHNEWMIADKNTDNIHFCNYHLKSRTKIHAILIYNEMQVLITNHN